jgi:hypothetical protein
MDCESVQERFLGPSQVSSTTWKDEHQIGVPRVGGEKPIVRWQLAWVPVHLPMERMSEAEK